MCISAWQNVPANLWVSKETERTSHHIVNKVAPGHSAPPPRKAILCPAPHMLLPRLQLSPPRGAFASCRRVIIKERKYLPHGATTFRIIPKRTLANFVLKGYSMNEMVKAHLSKYCVVSVSFQAPNSLSAWAPPSVISVLALPAGHAAPHFFTPLWL